MSFLIKYTPLEKGGGGQRTVKLWKERRHCASAPDFYSVPSLRPRAITEEEKIQVIEGFEEKELLLGRWEFFVKQRDRTKNKHIFTIFSPPFFFKVTQNSGTS